jgi:ribosome-associated toxin RatA of RatAB toxin-antitoxin module
MFLQQKEKIMKAVLSLRLALAVNAVFSLSFALLMLFRPVLVGEWLGIDAASLILQFIGIGLVVFATALIYIATRQRVATWHALLICAADFSWVIGSVVLLLALPQLFSPFGNALVLAVAGAVFTFGAWQLWGAERVHSIGETGEYRHCIIVETNAPAEKMWRVVGNIGDIKNYMPSLKCSVVLDGKAPGVGAIRACEDHAGKQWSEECIAFNPGHSFAVRFLSEAPNFPFPAKTMRGGWEVTPSNGGSRVMVWWELTPKSKLLAPVILPLLAFQADRDFPRIIERMAAAALGKNGEVQMQSNGSVFARLLPSLC